MMPTSLTTPNGRVTLPSPSEDGAPRAIATALNRWPSAGVAVAVMRPHLSARCYDIWVAAVIGFALYVGWRLFAPAEGADLAHELGPEWDACRRRVKAPWV